MKTKQIEVNGRKLTLHADGRVFYHEFTDSMGRIRVGRFLKSRKCGSYLARGCMIKKKKWDGYIHRIVAEVMLPDWDKKLEVDHIDGDKGNNHWSNLRMVTPSKNQRSFKSKCLNATSKYRGVCFYKRTGDWFVQCSVKRKSTFGGYFQNEVLAALAYDRIAESLGFNPEALNRNNYPEVMEAYSKII